MNIVDFYFLLYFLFSQFFEIIGSGCFISGSIGSKIFPFIIFFLAVSPFSVCRLVPSMKRAFHRQFLLIPLPVQILLHRTMYYQYLELTQAWCDIKRSGHLFSSVLGTLASGADIEIPVELLCVVLRLQTRCDCHSCFASL